MVGPEHPVSGEPTRDSPLGLAETVDQLLNLPGHLCKQRGICCRVATFKGLMTRPEIEALAQQDEGMLGEMARDFMSIFIPYDSVAEVATLTPEFVQRVNAQAIPMGRAPENVGYFHCRYVLEDGRCGVHADRPIGCRKYPLAHEQTLFHPGCGYEAQAKANWAQVKAIMESLNLSLESNLEAG